MIPMKTKVFIFLVALTVRSSAGEVTASIKRDVRRGQSAAMSAITSASAFPSSAMRAFLAAEKKCAKESDAFKLGFAEGVCSHMTTAYEFSLSLPREELQQAGTGWVIFSSKATILQATMHLTDTQMVELLSEAGFHKIKTRPGPL